MIVGRLYVTFFYFIRKSGLKLEKRRIKRSVHINSHTTVAQMGVFCISVLLGWNQSEPMRMVSAGAGK